MTTTFDNRDDLLKPKDAAAFLKLSLSWLAKARMSGDGPPYIKFGKSIRYSKAALLAWLRSHQR
jgi:predicted DNA-binding transcriptional regulator AlpA